jgi:hypothetical protein
LTNKIGSWIIRKWIWFLFILIGFIAYWNLLPAWQEMEQQAADAKFAIATKESISQRLLRLKEDNVNAITKAASETNLLLDQHIIDESREIEALKSKLAAVRGFGITKEIERGVLGYEIDFAKWRYNELIRIRNQRLDAAERPGKIAETRARLQQKETLYTTKLREYESIQIGNNTGNQTINSSSTGLINQANKLIAWSGYEIKDANAVHQELITINDEVRALKSQVESLLRPQVSPANDMPSIERIILEINALAKQATDTYESSWVNKRIVQPAIEYWPAALLTVIVAIALSPLARLLCFFVLAPMASRQSPILLDHRYSSRIAAKGEMSSAAGLSLRLNPDEVLLVHHDFTKAIPKQCTVSTQLILDRKSMLTSAFSGLYNLARIEPSEEISIQLSAGHDGLNELIRVELPSESDLVIEPSNIVGVVTKKGQSVLLGKHWVLGKLQSWLKWRFRYITISGPLTVILKGGRGVIVTPVNKELMIAPDFVVAFSSCLAFGTSRTETFAGYYSRKRNLLNDQFLGTQGVVIHQEANVCSGTAGIKKSGLEGLVDGVLKAFGI